MSAGQRPGRTDLLAIAEVAYREATTEALLDAIAKDPERTLKRIAEGTPVLTHSGNWVSPPEGGGRPPAPPNRVAWLAALTPALDRAFSAAGPADSFAHYELRKLIGAVLGFAVGL